MTFVIILTNSVHSLMHLRPTSYFEILCTIKQLRNKSCRLDKIHTKFVPLAAEALLWLCVCYLMHVFNMDFFPTCLKEAKVVPVFKSGDRRN